MCACVLCFFCAVCAALGVGGVFFSGGGGEKRARAQGHGGNTLTHKELTFFKKSL